MCRFVLILWLSAVFLPSLAGAAEPTAVATEAAKVETNVYDQAQAALDKARKDLDALATKLALPGLDDAQLADLRVNVDAVGAATLNATVALRPRFEAIKARMTALGEPPAAGATPEDPAIKDERIVLATERSRINKMTADAEDLSLAVNKISNKITEMRRTLFAEALFSQTTMSSDVQAEAKQALRTEFTDFVRTIDSWMTFVWKFKRSQLLSSLFLSLTVALAGVVSIYRLFAPLIRRDREAVDAAYISRLSVAFWSTILPSLTAAFFATSTYFFLLNFNVLRPDVSPIVESLMIVIVGVFFVFRLASAIFAPGKPNWRLVPVTNSGARLLVIAIVALSFVNAFDYWMTTVSKALDSPVVLTVFKSYLSSIVSGLILLAMAFFRPLQPLEADPSQKARGWPRIISLALGLAGLLLVVTTLTGYVGLARFVATQIVSTGAILVTMYIGLMTGKAVSKQHDFAKTSMGQWLSRRFSFGDIALDQVGLVAGLMIYAMVLLIGLPLILLQWGFQVRDIQVWFYQVFTDIHIGNISISIIGIVSGILVFTVGLFATKWTQKWLDGNVLARSNVDLGVRNSVRTGLGYLGVAVAGLIGVSAAGIDLSSIALVAGALSLGIGFGLQNIVSNFVSGLILLAERPFKVGDWVVTGATEGFVKRISVRATEIETFQHQSIIVPNSELINASVGNWTHRNRLGRSEIAVGVSYDSDPRKVMDILLELAKNHPLVLSEPEPNVAFLGFGDYSLDFELRVYLADLMNGTIVRNDLRLAIFERFRQERIEIPVPQRNLNIRMDGEAKDVNDPSADSTISPLAAGQLRKIIASKSEASGS
jgi:small-conductance mechanosensitive channel